MTLIDDINQAQAYLRDQGMSQAEIGLVLGSGLGDLADQVDNRLAIPYRDIPHFPTSTVSGHQGLLIYGDLAGKKVLAMQGRFHYYEGYTMKEVTFPIRVMKALGAHSLIVTNAAGGVNPNFKPGDLMLIKDQLNLTGDNPLIGFNHDQLGPRFPDMSQSYDQDYQELILDQAGKLGICLQEGVYAGLSGPTYETPAEVNMVGILGGDAVGMSTVAEAIVAKHSQMKLAGLSCITNLAAGLQETLSHEEVIETTQAVKDKFKSLVLAFLETI